MTDEQFELASAYLDGAVTDDERARVENDSELLAAVRELRAISAAMADADPPAPAARENAIAAALAAFDEMRAFGDVDESDDAGTELMPATPPPDVPPAPVLAGLDQSSVHDGDALVVPLAPRRRFRLGHAVSVAAAAVVVLAGGIALLRDDAEAPTNDAINEATARTTIAGLPSAAGTGGTAGPAVTVAPATTGAAMVTVTTAAAEGGPSVTQRVTEADAAAEDATEDATADDAADAEEPANDAAPGGPDDPAGEAPPATTIPALPAAPAPDAAGGTPDSLAESAAVAASDTDAVSADAADADVGDPPAAAAVSSSPAELVAPSVAVSGDPGFATPSEPPVLRGREEFVEFTDGLLVADMTMAAAAAPDSSVANYTPPTTVPPLPLPQAVTRCLTPGSEPLRSDATYVTDDGTEHPIAVVDVGVAGESPAYGGLDVVTCELVVDTAEPSLVTTTTSTTSSSTPAG